MPPGRTPITRARLSRTIARLVPAMLAALASATCDATSVLGPAGVENISLSFSGDTSVIVGSRVAPRIDVQVEGSAVSDPRVRFLSSDTTVLAVTTSGDSIIARRVGSAIITATLESSILPKHPPSVTQRVHVTVGGLVADRVSLDLTSLGDTATLGVVALDANGQPLSGIAVTWVSADSTIAHVDARGRVTARGNGTTNVFGFVGLDSATTSVRVSQKVQRFSFDPGSLRLDALGATGIVVATGLDANDSLVTSVVPEWTIDDPTIATIDPAGVVVARRNGVTWARAHFGTREDSLRVIVDQRAVLVVITPTAGFDIPAVGDRLQFVAVGFDRLNMAVNDGRPSWYTLDPVVAQVDEEGYVSGVSAGSARIVASQDGAEDTVVIRVTNVPVSLTVLPGVATMASVGDTLPLQAVLRNSRGDIVSTTAGWHTPEPNIVQVNPDGRVIARAAGMARVVASASGLADTAAITVTNAPASVDIVPASVKLGYLGDTLTPEIHVRNARGDQLSADMVTWSSDAPAIASVGTAGRITAHSMGFTWVRAASGATRDSVRVEVENGPQSIDISLTSDTVAAPSQQLQVTALVRSSTGSIMPGYATEWSTTNPAVATVSSSGVVTAVGYGSASIIGRAGAAADTGTIVVRNLTKIHVDNGSSILPAYGTRSRPFTRIGDAVAIATAFDTVYVNASGIPYSELVHVQSRIVLLGDSAAYLAAANDASRLPTISHDTGSVGLLVTTGLPVSVRYLAIRHAIDGFAIDARNTDVRIEHVHVNSGVTAPVGGGILVRNAPAFAVVENSTVRAVRGFGVHFTSSAGVRATAVDVRNVAAQSGYSGGGIVINRGSGAIVDRATVRNTAGPQIQVDTASGTTISNSDLAGRAQLVRLTGLTGSTLVSGNTFNLSRQAGEPFTLGSEFDGRSGLEIRLSGTVTVSGNVFTEPASQQMDAIRMIDARSGAAGGATILSNRFEGGRYHVGSLRSTWSMTGARSTGAVISIVAEAVDTIALTSDTLENASGSTCVRSTGSSSRLTIASSELRSCTVAGMATGGPAITVSGSGTSLTVTNSDLSGPDQTAIDFAALNLVVRGTRMSGAGSRSVTGFASPAVLEVDPSGTVELVGNVISNYRELTGVLIPDGTIRIDSNRVTRNAVGVRILEPRNTQMRGNDIFDNLPTGAQNDRTVRDLIAEGNWWGDSRGPRRGDAPAATGDTLFGRVDFSPFATAPHAAGTVATSLRAVRGDGQEGLALMTLPQALTVRAVDSDGRPVANVSVTFTVASGGGSFAGSSTRTVTTDASGLAEASLTLGLPGQVRVTVSAPGVPVLTLTATAR